MAWGGELNATFKFSNALRRARGIVWPNIVAYVDRCFGTEHRRALHISFKPCRLRSREVVSTLRINVHIPKRNTITLEYRYSALANNLRTLFPDVSTIFATDGCAAKRLLIELNVTQVGAICSMEGQTFAQSTTVCGNKFNK